MRIKFPAAKWVAKGFKALTRKKSAHNYSESQLARVLSTFDLTYLGIGSTLGIGVYVLTGQVAKDISGPAVTLSFFIAGLASVLAGLCYAEIGPRVPRAGSAYNYSYVTVGELMAFFIGWNMILEYSIGAASVAKSLSQYLDSMLGYSIRNFLSTNIPISVPGLSNYPDIFAFAITIIFSIPIALGAKKSSLFNKIFTVINLFIIAVIILAGIFIVNSRNWQLPDWSIPTGYGDGGYMPYGFSGVLRGAAVCFYGFIAFDSIANAGEEAKYPRRSIPLALGISLTMILAAYIFTGMILTMVIPYYEVDSNAPMLYLFPSKGWEYFVMIGATFGLFSSLMSSIFPLSRVVLAMSSDGLLFKFMGRIHENFQIPFVGTLVSGLITAIVAMLFDLSDLVRMLSIGTLLAYTMVACSVMILRYQIDESGTDHQTVDWNQINNNFLKKICNYDEVRIPSKYSARITTWGCVLYCVLALALSIILKFFVEESTEDNFWIYISIGLGAVIFFNVLLIRRQPCSKSTLSFHTPAVPWLPAASIFINLHLIVQLDSTTWLRFIIWIATGIVIYFFYGIWNSKERKQKSLTQNGWLNANNNRSDIPVATISDTVF